MSEIRDQIRQVLFNLYPASYGDDGECQLQAGGGSRTFYIDGNDIADALTSLIVQVELEGRIDEQENEVVYCDIKEVRRCYGNSAGILGKIYNETREIRLKELKQQLKSESE